MLEDISYDVVFSEGKYFLRNKATGKAKNIWIFMYNLYKIHVDGCTTLMGNAEKVVRRDEGELWKMRLGHLHHRSLNVRYNIYTGPPKGTIV